MTFIIFLIILGVLVFVHELGHFLAAKKAGVEVEEFGFGYPPRALILGRKWGTLFSLNWIPFGGFVKIVGEDYEDEKSQTVSQPISNLEDKNSDNISSVTEISSVEIRQSDGEVFVEEKILQTSNISLFPKGSADNNSKKRFTEVSKKWQAAILAAGVFFNLLFAWILFSTGFVIGLPTSEENDFGAEVKNAALTITAVVPDSPAQKVGLKSGDKIENISLASGKKLQELKPENVSDFINDSLGPVIIEVERGGQVLDFKVAPEPGLMEGRKIIGINMDNVGTLSLPLHKAIYQGGRSTLKLTYLTFEGITGLIGNAFMGKADMSQVTGPVGIIGLVGDASRLGFSYLITFTALISINLAIINLVPFPALDGGRIVVVAIEGLTKKPLNPKIIHTLNTVGFFLLIALMLIITYRDILKLF